MLTINEISKLTCIKVFIIDRSNILVAYYWVTQNTNKQQNILALHNLITLNNHNTQ